jgi:hypothetical protein
MLLNKPSIAEKLRELVAHLGAGNLDQAQAVRDILDFERLRNPGADPSKGPLRLVDPARPFGIERVAQAGDHIRRCQEAISRGDGQSALDQAKSALVRRSDAS